jgi:hypothetical protein
MQKNYLKNYHFSAPKYTRQLIVCYNTNQSQFFILLFFVCSKLKSQNDDKEIQTGALRIFPRFQH